MDNSDIKPSTIMLIAGGAVLLISTFLDWYSLDVDTGGFDFGGSFDANAWDTDFFGLLGIFCAIIGLVIAGGVAAQQFGNVSMPDEIFGFSHDQIHLVLSSSPSVSSSGARWGSDSSWRSSPPR